MVRVRFYCLFSIGLVGLGLVQGRSQAPKNAIGQELAKAKSAYDTRQYKASEEILKRILAGTPASFAANELLGMVLSAEGKRGSATVYFQAAVQADPSSALARANLATNLAQLNRNSLAEGEFRKALQLDPGSYELNHNLGEFYVRAGRFSDAVPFLKEAQKLQPSSYANGYDLALAAIKAEMLQEADLQLATLLKIADTAELHGLLGAVREKQGRFVDAAAEMQRAAQIEPTEDNVFDWGAELLHHQTLEPAVQVFGKGARLFPRSWRMQIGLGLSLYLNEDYERSVEAFCSAIDLAPSDPRPYSFLANVTPLPPVNAQEAIARFERYAAAQPTNPQALYYYAVSLWDPARQQPGAEEFAKVEALLHRALALKPAFAEAHLQLGILYSSRQNHSMAARAYEKAVDLNPSLSLAHYRLGQALVQLGDEERGRRQLEIWNRLRSREREENEKTRAQLSQFVYSSPTDANQKQ